MMMMGWDIVGVDVGMDGMRLTTVIPLRFRYVPLVWTRSILISVQHTVFQCMI